MCFPQECNEGYTRIIGSSAQIVLEDGDTYNYVVGDTLYIADGYNYVVGDMQNHNCLYQSDLDFLQILINNNDSTSNIDYDSNENGIIEPLEIAYTVWDWGNGRLTMLNSISSTLSSEIPPEIGNLTNLRYLNLHSNQMTGEIPPVIGNLTNLTYLSLSDNKLTGEIPSEIGNLINLEYLGIHDNQLSGKIPSEIGNLVNLSTLVLWENQLTEIPSEIGNLINLVNLNISNNQLTTLPESICNQGDSSPSLSNNQLCEEYHYDCIDDWGEQDDSNCDCNGITEGNEIIDECGVCGGNCFGGLGAECYPYNCSGDCIATGDGLDNNGLDCMGLCGGSSYPNFSCLNGELVCSIINCYDLAINSQIIPDNYNISSIHPNPFNPITTITYGLPENTDSQITVFNLSGTQITTLENTFQTAGYHTLSWNASSYPSGVYLIRMDSGDFTQTQKVVLVK